MSQNIFSLEGLISWLETQPSDGVYLYSANNNCLIAQYFRTRGVLLGPMSVGSCTWDDADGQDHDMPDYFDDVALWGNPTYGDALERAKSALSGRGVPHL